MKPKGFNDIFGKNKNRKGIKFEYNFNFNQI